MPSRHYHMKFFCFLSDSHWMSCRLVEGLSIICYFVGVIKNEVLQQVSLLLVSAFRSVFVALASA